MSSSGVGGSGAYCGRLGYAVADVLALVTDGGVYTRRGVVDAMTCHAPSYVPPPGVDRHFRRQAPVLVRISLSTILGESPAGRNVAT